jgi:hypothetical protein
MRAHEDQVERNRPKLFDICAECGSKTLIEFRPEIRVCFLGPDAETARKLIDSDGRPSPAFEARIADSITIGNRIMNRIDSRWPVHSDDPSSGNCANFASARRTRT